MVVEEPGVAAAGAEERAEAAVAEDEVAASCVGEYRNGAGARLANNPTHGYVHPASGAHAT